MTSGSVLVGIGGNALIPDTSHGTVEEQWGHAERIAAALAPLWDTYGSVTLIHGNGPQVGNDLIRVEESFTKVPPLPLYLCGANTQGNIGFMLETALRNHFHAKNKPVLILATVVTAVEVDADDSAFRNPHRPIGPFVTRYRATHLMEIEKVAMVEGAGRGYRRVVPSPVPRRIVNLDTLERLFKSGVSLIPARLPWCGALDAAVTLTRTTGALLARSSSSAPTSLVRAYLVSTRRTRIVPNVSEARVCIWTTARFLRLHGSGETAWFPDRRRAVRHQRRASALAERRTIVRMAA